MLDVTPLRESQEQDDLALLKAVKNVLKQHPHELEAVVCFALDAAGNPVTLFQSKGNSLSELRGLAEDGLDILKGLIQQKRIAAAEEARRRGPAIVVPDLRVPRNQ